MTLQVANNAFGELNADITDTGTTIVLKSGNGARFPSLAGSQYFYATLIDTNNNLEIIKATARSSDTLTVVRAQDGTSGRAFVANDRIELRPVAAFFDTYQQKETSVDLNGTELILDADADTSITADTDDTIDIKIGGSDKVRIDSSGRVLIGTTNNAFGTADADDLVVGNSVGNHGITIASNSSNGYSSILFSDADSGNGRLAGYIDYGHSANEMTFGGGGAGDTIMKLTSNKDVKIQAGDIFFATAGKGINLGVTSNTDSNTLDDYEEGECSLVMGGLTNISTSAAHIQANNNYSGGQAHYVKIGTLCYVQAYFFSQATSTQAAGDLVIQGLPFAAAGNGGSFVSQSYNLTLPASNGQQVAIFQAAGGTQLNGQLLRNGATWASVNSNVMPNGTAIYFRIAGTYRTQ